MTETMDRAKDVLRYPRKVRSRAGQGDSKQNLGRYSHRKLVGSSLRVDVCARINKYAVSVVLYE